MKALQTIAQKEATRKEFLTILGLCLLSIMGIESITKLFIGKRPSEHLRRYTGNSGYGR